MKKREIKTIEIGETFKENKRIEENYYNRNSEYKTLYECYGRPSDAKIYIYNKYEKMLFDNCDCVYNYGIRSYNSMIIVLHAIVRKNNKTYYLLITPSYNYFKEIEENEE